jgi:alanine racemase
MTVEPSDAGLSLPVLPRAAWVEVDLGAIVGNILALRTLAGPGCGLAAVVKADGYGHGIELAARAARHAGVAYASVAALDEALRLRAVGDTGPILVNYPLPVDALPEAAAAVIEVVAGSEPDVAALVRMGPAAPGVHLEVDTGMTRGGLAAADFGDAARRLAAAGVPIRGVWSHLLDYQDPSRVRQQVAAFEEAIAGLRRLGIDPPLRHLSASGGLLSGAPTYDLVRPGLVMYGVPPDHSLRDVIDRAGLRPALAVVAEPVRIADVPVGTTVGYSGTWVADRPSRIATLPIGYADSWARGAGPRTPVLFRGQRVPVVGRISSDSMTVDITDVPGSGSGAGDDGRFVLLGTTGDDVITADDVAESRDTISWEVLQGLSHRLPRRYLLEGVVVAIRRSHRSGVDAVPDLDERLARFRGSLEAVS